LFFSPFLVSKSLREDIDYSNPDEIIIAVY